MKFFTITFSIYILALALMPCGDAHDCNDIQDTQISANTDHGNHKHETETCSPFCICSCCGSNVINMDDLATFSDIVPVYLKSTPVYNKTFNSVVHSHIWQPPKTS